MSKIRTAPNGGGRSSLALPLQRGFLIAALFAPLFWLNVTKAIYERLSIEAPPVYELSLGSEHPDHDDLSPAAEPSLRLSEASLLQLTLRPEHRFGSRVVLHSFVARDGQLAAWPVHFDQAPSGVFRLRVPVRQLPWLQRGQGQLFFVLSARPLPALFDMTWDALSLLGWLPPPQILTCPFEIIAANPG